MSEDGGARPSPLAGEGGPRSGSDEGSRRATTRHATVRQARALRRNAPSTERVLWKLLRDRRLHGVKFRRQIPIGPYIIDFICLHHRLIIEADGPFHDPERDTERDAWLTRQGFRVLRFSNGEINGPGGWRVLTRILSAVSRPPAIDV